MALGIHLRQGAIGDFLPAAPFVADYFGLTKLGAVYGVAALFPLLGGEGAFRLEMWVGAALTLGATAYLVRKWAGASWLAAGIALLLIPGVAESFYFFNDNVPAAGLMLLALAVWTRWTTYAAAVLAGALIGCAVAVRLDTVVVACAAAPLVALNSQTLRGAIPRTAVAGASALTVLWLAFALVGCTPIDAVKAGQYATKLWGWSNNPSRFVLVAILYLGLPCVVLTFPQESGPF